MILVFKANDIHELRADIVQCLRRIAKTEVPKPWHRTKIEQAQAHARVAALNSAAEVIANAELEITDDLDRLSPEVNPDPSKASES